MPIRNPEIECMPREQLKQLQSERLVAQVARMYEKVECFRNRMDAKGLKPSDIHGVEDLHKIPFSYKSDLRDYYPYGLFAEPLKNIVRVHASSGTTGKRIVVGYTKNDLDMWAECVARMMNGLGIDENSIVQIAYGYGLFTGGLGAHGGAEKTNATVIPISSGNTALQIQTMIDFQSTVLCCTPSYAMYLGEEVQKLGVKDQLKLKVGIFGAEPWSEDMRLKIEEALASRHMISTVFLRSSVPAYPVNVNTSAACTFGKITSSPKSSTPTPARFCPLVQLASLFSRPSPRKASPSSVIVLVTSAL